MRVLEKIRMKDVIPLQDREMKAICGGSGYIQCSVYANNGYIYMSGSCGLSSYDACMRACIEEHASQFGSGVFCGCRE
jgi:hypothetical protein